jgi:transmembrane 9 superfamily protein 2/4
MSRLTTALTIAVLSISGASAFYVPGVKSATFKKGDEVQMKVNAVTSIHTQIPKPYYRLPFCKPEGGPQMASENLGEFLTGNKVQNSAYNINMLEEVFCNKVCQVELTARESRFLTLHVRNAYHNNWIIDNLPSASIGTSDAGPRQTHYAGGFPIGFVDSQSGEDKTAYVYNHVNINLSYHQPVQGEDGYRVVGFTVEPLSINHQFLSGYNWDGESKEGYTKPLATCTAGEHSSRDKVTKNQVVAEGERIMYTYDVIWKESDVAWSSRWDVYLNEDNLVPSEVHWYSITNSFVVVIFLSLLVVSILIRNLKRDIAGYNAIAAIADEELDEDDDETGWKLVHADVFRPPFNYPMLYCVLIGSGFQIAVSTITCIILSAIGFVNPSRRGSFMTATLVMYALCGIFSGYLSSRLYKAFRGRSWQLCTILTSTFFPSLCFLLFLFFNTILAFFRSSGSVPFLDILIVAAMWLCIAVPLTFLGAYFGYKEEALQYPTVTSTIARAIPESGITTKPYISIAMAGIVPFAAAYVELFFIMSSLCMGQEEELLEKPVSIC